LTTTSTMSCRNTSSMGRPSAAAADGSDRAGLDHLAGLGPSRDLAALDRPLE
jgi:hypothetical protein